MSMTNKAYDTTELKNLISDFSSKNKKNLTKIIREVAELCDGNEHTIKGRINGYGALLEDEIAALAIVLGVTEEEVSNRVKKKSLASPSLKEKKIACHTTPDSSPFWYTPNYDNIIETIEKSKLSRSEICKRAGLSKNFFIRIKTTQKVRRVFAEGLAKTLDVDINDLFTPFPSSKDDAPCAPCESNSGTSNECCIPNLRVIDREIKKRGWTTKLFLQKAGLCDSVYSLWEKGERTTMSVALTVSKLLGIPTEEGFTLLQNPDSTDFEDQPKTPPAKLTSVEGILQVFDVFNILNNNLQSIYDSIYDNNPSAAIEALKAEFGTKFDALSVKLDNLTAEVKGFRKDLLMLEREKKEKVVTLEAKDDLGDEDIALSQKDADKTDKEESDSVLTPFSLTIKNEQATPARSTEPLSIMQTTYKVDDTLEEYANKINSMAVRLARYKDTSKDKVLNNCYLEMSAYGVNWDELKTDYKTRHGSSQAWCLALLHDNAIFGSIFFNLLRENYWDAEKKNMRRSIK